MNLGQHGWFEAACLFGAACLVPAGGAQEHAHGASVALDRVELQHETDRSVLSVYHEKGIGRAEFTVPRIGWPPALAVRLHGFPELESFTAMSKSAKLQCVLIRQERQPPIYSCELEGARVGALARKPDHFEVVVPGTLLISDSATITLEWVDQWR